jgi:hypothetical protein
LALSAAACWSEILMVTVIIGQAFVFSLRDIERSVTFFKENTSPEQGVTLRFGQIASGSSDAKLGCETHAGRRREPPPICHRGISIPPRPRHTAATPPPGSGTARDLTDRFADCYYIISDADFRKLKLERKRPPAAPRAET